MSANGIQTLSGRVGPQSGLAVTDVERTIGVGSSGSPDRTGVYVEDMISARCTVRNAGGTLLNITAAKVQANPFSPDESDSRWVDLVPFPNLPLLPGGSAERVIVQVEGYRWLRVRANCGAGDTATMDVVWSGSQG